MKKILFVLAFLMSTSSLFSQAVFTSTCGYTITVDIKPVSIITQPVNGGGGYGYDVKYQYNVMISGSSNCGNNLYTFQTIINCKTTNGESGGYNLPKKLQNSTGYLTTSTNQQANGTGILPSSANVDNFQCNEIKVIIEGPGIPSQSLIIKPVTLPIELISFDASANKNQVDLTWATASEKNNDFFTIERTVDGIDFEEIGKVAGQGNSSIKNEYTFSDTRPKNGVSYYRLKQTDYNGESEYFEVKSVNILKGIFVSNVYPNPAVMNRTTVFIEKTKDVVTLNVRNVLGQLISSKDIDATSNDVTVEVELIGSDKMYFIEFIQNNVNLARYKVLNN